MNVVPQAIFHPPELVSVEIGGDAEGEDVGKLVAVHAARPHEQEAGTADRGAAQVVGQRSVVPLSRLLNTCNHRRATVEAIFTCCE